MLSGWTSLKFCRLVKSERNFIILGMLNFIVSYAIYALILDNCNFISWSRVQLMYDLNDEICL